MAVVARYTRHYCHRPLRVSQSQMLMLRLLRWLVLLCTIRLCVSIHCFGQQDTQCGMYLRRFRIGDAVVEQK